MEKDTTVLKNKRKGGKKARIIVPRESDNVERSRNVTISLTTPNPTQNYGFCNPGPVTATTTTHNFIIKTESGLPINSITNNEDNNTLILQTKFAPPNTNPPAEKPLIVLLDGRDCTVELSVLKDYATVAFCNAIKIEDVHEKVINEAFGILLWHTITIKREHLEKFKNLKMIVRIGSGYENIDIKAAGELGIVVSNISGCDVGEVADSTISLILNLYRQTYWLANFMKEGKNIVGPDQIAAASQCCKRIRGNTLGLIGLGRIGVAVALRAKVFGFRVIFFDPLLPDGVDTSLGISRYYSLVDLLQESDCISLHCELTDFNRHIINEATIKQMKYGSFLVNTAHGRLIDEYALTTALKLGHIRGAALDVHENEPNIIPMGPLGTAPNLITTPHTAFYSQESYSELRQLAALEMCRFLIHKNPESLRNWVNRKYFRLPGQTLPLVNVTSSAASSPTDTASTSGLRTATKRGNSSTKK